MKKTSVIFSLAHSDQIYTLNQKAPLTMRKINDCNIDGLATRLSPSVRWWVIGTFEPALGTSSFSTIDELRTVDPGDTTADIIMYYD